MSETVEIVPYPSGLERQGVPAFFTDLDLYAAAVELKGKIEALAQLRNRMNETAKEMKKWADKLLDDDTPTCIILQKLHALWDEYQKLYQQHREYSEAVMSTYRRSAIYRMLGEPPKMALEVVARVIDPTQLRLTREKLAARLRTLEAQRESLQRDISAIDAELRSELMASAEWADVMRAVSDYRAERARLIEQYKTGRMSKERFDAEIDSLVWKTISTIISKLNTWRQRQAALWKSHDDKKADLAKVEETIRYLTLDCEEKKRIREQGGWIEP
ncbi:MAG: hypothetical protein QXE23_08765 [Nitrososphaerota archaeon]